MARSPGQEVAAALGVLLQRSFRSALYGELTRDMGPGVDEATYPVLSGLERVGSCSAADLATAIGLDRSGVSRRASRLERAGLICRVADPSDARAVLLVLTDTGRSTVATMRKRLVSRINASFAGWPEGQAEAFASGLRRFIDQGPFSTT